MCLEIGCANTGQLFFVANFPLQLHGEDTKCRSREGGGQGVDRTNTGGSRLPRTQNTPSLLLEILHQKTVPSPYCCMRLGESQPWEGILAFPCQFERIYPDKPFLAWAPTPNRSHLWPQVQQNSEQISLDAQGATSFFSTTYSCPFLLFSLHILYFYTFVEEKQNAHILSTAIGLF